MRQKKPTPHEMACSNYHRHIDLCRKCHDNVSNESKMCARGRNLYRECVRLYNLQGKMKIRRPGPTGLQG